MKGETATLEQDSQLHKRQHHRRTQQRERRSHHKHKCPHGKKKDHLHTITQEAERAQGAQKDEIKEGEKNTEGTIVGKFYENGEVEVVVEYMYGNMPFPIKQTLENRDTGRV